MGPDLSVIIVSHNARDVLGRCLRSVLRGGGGPPAAEIIVVDNASADGTASGVRAEFPGVKVIENPENVGYARANNLGARLSRGTALLFLNPDTEVRDDAVAKCLRFLDANPRADVVGARLVGPDGRPQVSCFKLPSLGGVAMEYVFRRPMHYPPSWAGRIFQPEGITGAFLLMRRQAWERVGFFDERYFLYMEEVDWFSRAKSLGIRVYFYPEAEVVHIGGHASRGAEGLAFWRLHRSRLMFFRARFRPAAFRVLKALTRVNAVMTIAADLGKAALGRITPAELADKGRYALRLLTMG